MGRWNGQYDIYRKKVTPLDCVTTVKGYAIENDINIRTVQRMCEDGRLKAKNVHGVWLIEY
ncbi:tRNA-dihydrouridine synthase [Paenibacillus sp. NAIST15-1]|nr:tRNA-dihydrouridine synthase [Paenibacillus sp. NAIST15-1]